MKGGELRLLHVDKDNRIIRFAEKPGESTLLDELRVPCLQKNTFSPAWV